MATIKVCDRCGKQSPDGEGKYIANHWWTIQAHRMNTNLINDRENENYLLCVNCYKEIIQEQIK